jgi:hypothetical protein
MYRPRPEHDRDQVCEFSYSYSHEPPTAPTARCR